MAVQLNLVVVEDNVRVREEMLAFLSRPEWLLHGVDCGESLNELLLTLEPHVVILDVNLPYEDGYSIAARLRETHPDVGIVMLTARVRPGDRASGYRAGADVYLTKPTHTSELLAVLDNLRRRLQPSAMESLVLNREDRQLCADGISCVQLSQHESRLLALLAMAPQRQLSSDFLLEALSGVEDRPISRDYLSVMVSRLRAKCQRLPGADALILSDRGLGYRLSRVVKLSSVSAC